METVASAGPLLLCGEESPVYRCSHPSVSENPPRAAAPHLPCCTSGKEREKSLLPGRAVPAPELFLICHYSSDGLSCKTWGTQLRPMVGT